VNLSPEKIAEALSLNEFDGFGAQAKMKPIPRPDQRPDGRQGQPRQGAVLLLLYPKAGTTHLVLTRRRDDLESHAGQISFPGGRREGVETLEQAALRETREEVGIHAASIAILGELAPLYIPPSDYEVHPFVGWHAHTPIFVPQPAEVAEIVEVPLKLLLARETRRQEIWERSGMSLEVPFYNIGQHKVWGATAMMLSEFVERVRALENSAQQA
jgi:8-oxo-dGTP pyrophosphatase MutT (NUDIX family)